MTTVNSTEEVKASSTTVNAPIKRPLRVTVAGGGPVGLSFAITLKDVMGSRVNIVIYDGRWINENDHVSWKSSEHGNSRRQQTVTLQSRQYSKLPEALLKRLFDADGHSTEMWPAGPDSPKETGAPKNIRISRIEDVMLEEASKREILLNPMNFDPDTMDISDQHVLVIADGPGSRTRDFHIDKFGAPSETPYSIEGHHLEDTVLGLRVKSDLDDATAVLLTISQNRFLLNSLNGEGFLNMRLTPEEAKEVVGIVPESEEFVECIQSHPCLMVRDKTTAKKKEEKFVCSHHGSSFKPSIDQTSFLWPRIKQGLELFSVKEENLTGITAFRLSMVQRPRFTSRILSPSATTPGTFGCLIGDAANAIHFWPGRGLNSGIASATSLARCLSQNWDGRAIREADFMRHEATMHMMQYRHKTRAWRAMVSTSDDGEEIAISKKIMDGLAMENDREAHLAKFLKTIISMRDRLGGRLGKLPSDQKLRNILAKIDDRTLKVLIESEPWDTRSMSGEEVDVDLLLSLDGRPKKVNLPKKPNPQPNRVETLDEGGERKKFGYTFIWGLLLGASCTYAVLQYEPLRAVLESIFS